MYGALATVLALLHAGLVLAVVLGAILALAGRLHGRPRWERAYYVLLVSVIAANVLWGECPLTHWEQQLRSMDAPGAAYRGSFLGHYLPFLTPPVLAWLGPTLMAAALLAAPFWRWRRRRETLRPHARISHD